MRCCKIKIKNFWTVYIICNCTLDSGILGLTETDYDKKVSIVKIGKTFLFEDFFDTLIHELKHVQSHICKYYNIPEGGEQAAYLIGYISRQFFKYFKTVNISTLKNK